jgi:all-trans-8'-apo-beta-carotenal 15,15'-oxygenase
MTNTTLSRRALMAGTGGALAAMMLSERAAAAAPVAADWRLATLSFNTEFTRPTALRRVHGRAPRDLGGVLYRNGPARFQVGTETPAHWFDGDGLMRRFAIEDGRATLTARFADTKKRRLETALGHNAQPGFGTPFGEGADVAGPDDSNAANTSVIKMGSEVWALWEAGSPIRMDGETLATIGPKQFGGQLNGMPFLAHPKVDRSGEVLNLAPGGRSVGLWRVRPDGTLNDFKLIRLARPAYMHDWALTDSWLVFILSPWIPGPMEGINTFSDAMTWRGDEPLIIELVNRDDHTVRRRYDLPAAAFYHTGGAWEDADGTVHVDIALSPTPSVTGQSGRDLTAGVWSVSSSPRLTRIRLPVSGAAVLEALTDSFTEFPVTDPRRNLMARRYSLCVSSPEAVTHFGSALRYIDLETGSSELVDLGTHQIVEEMQIVPKPGRTGEREAWAVGTSLNLRERATELHVFDLENLWAGPVVTWRAPVAMPIGFHGKWVD